MNDDDMAWWRDPRTHEWIGEAVLLRRLLKRAMQHVPINPLSVMHMELTVLSDREHLQRLGQERALELAAKAGVDPSEVGGGA